MFSAEDDLAVLSPVSSHGEKAFDRDLDVWTVVAIEMAEFNLTCFFENIELEKEKAVRPLREREEVESRRKEA